MKRSKPKRKKPEHPVTAYAQAVIDGEIVTGRLVRLACERHLRDLKDGHKRGLRFDPDLANHALEFFPKFLRHNEGRYAAQPFKLSPHQEFIIGNLYGWIKTANRWRRFRHCYWEEGKGGGKTPTASGCAIYGLTMDGEQGAEIYCAAVTRDQAGIAFRDCRHMAEKSVFADRLVITEHNIAYEATNSFIRPVSSEARSLDGKRVFMSLIDEEHEHASPLVIDKMTAGNKGREQPLNIRTTNSGYDRTSICWFEHEYTREVLEQLRDDDDWFGFICQLDTCDKCLAEGKSSPQDDCNECDHWWDESKWIKANPNLDCSITREYLRSEVAKALAMPSKALTVKRLNFCIWTEQAAHWMPLDEWDSCAAYPVVKEHLKGRRCYGGIDLGDTSDTTGMVLCFPPSKVEEEPYILLTFAWIPADMTRRTGKDRERFKAWISQGFIEATEGNRIDHRHVARVLKRVRTDFDLRIVGIDPYHAEHFSTFADEEAGFTVDQTEAERAGKPLLFKYGQSMAHLAAPTQNFLDMVLRRKIAHGGHPVLRWMIANVVVSPDSNGNIKPEKGKSADKIDCACAAIMALDLAVRNANTEFRSVYEDRGILFL